MSCQFWGAISAGCEAAVKALALVPWHKGFDKLSEHSSWSPERQLSCIGQKHMPASERPLWVVSGSRTVTPSAAGLRPTVSFDQYTEHREADIPPSAPNLTQPPKRDIGRQRPNHDHWPVAIERRPPCKNTSEKFSGQSGREMHYNA